jgi:hypothetical protein
MHRKLTSITGIILCCNSTGLLSCPGHSGTVTAQIVHNTQHYCSTSIAACVVQLIVAGAPGPVRNWVAHSAKVFSLHTAHAAIKLPLCMAEPPYLFRHITGNGPDSAPLCSRTDSATQQYGGRIQATLRSILIRANQLFSWCRLLNLELPWRIIQKGTHRSSQPS